jgi:hypothetical protein
MRKLLAMISLAALPLAADDRSKETVSAAHTERFNVSAAGTIRVDNSFGEVDIDGWDRPEVEVTTVRAAERFYDPKDRGRAQQRLDSVQITSQQQANDVTISTAYPARNGVLHPLSRRSDVEITYKIHAPRASKLVIRHNRGGLNVYDIDGDIHATVINGQITLTLPAAGQYAIDAQCTIGDVHSDFEGRERRRQILGQEFNHPGAAPTANLYLRVRFGDIIIQKLHGPPTE